jgi:hypothetical protein
VDKIVDLDFFNLVINIKFSIEFEQNIVNIHLLDHVVRQNIINNIFETSNDSQTKVVISIFQFLKWSIVKFGLLKSLE